ncbi:MAG: hypothetical protein ABIW79_04450 [Gemmatimonas sp.]
MPPKKPNQKPHPKSAKAAEQKVGKSARKAAEVGGKKPVIWQKADRPVRRLPGSVPLAPAIDPFEPRVKTFESIATRAVEASVSDLYRAFNDPNRRGWCHARGYAVRASVAPRSLVLGLVDGTSASVLIARKGNTRCVITVVQKGITDPGAAERARGDWRASLDRLSGMMAE